MPKLTLENAIRAAWSLHLAGALPDLPGISTGKLHDVNGMAPWLRLALGDEAARELETSKRAGWGMEAMLGVNGAARLHGPVLEAAADEMHTICVVGRLCSEHDASPLHAFLRWQADGTETSSAEAFLAPFRAAVDGSIENWSSPMSQWREPILRAAAEASGIELDSQPADLSAWSERSVDAHIAGIVGEDRAPNGFLKRLGYAVLSCSDGIERDLPDARGTREAGSHLYPVGAHVGMRLRLTFRGATSGHPGYLSAVRDLGMQETMEEIRVYLARNAEVSRIIAEYQAKVAAGCPDANGRLIAERDRVTLLRGCLEAGEGTTGRVLELCGEVVMVDFGGRIGHVPCYPQALAVLETA